jgi:hypothetical protein
MPRRDLAAPTASLPVLAPDSLPPVMVFRSASPTPPAPTLCPVACAPFACLWVPEVCLACELRKCLGSAASPPFGAAAGSLMISSWEWPWPFRTGDHPWRTRRGQAAGGSGHDRGTRPERPRVPRPSPERRPLYVRGWPETAGLTGISRDAVPRNATALEAGKTPVTGCFRWWWQVLGSNQRRLSRRFYRESPATGPHGAMTCANMLPERG